MIFIINDEKQNLLKKVLIIVFWFFVWMILSSLVKKEVILPSPLAVLLQLRALVFEMKFWQTVVNSLSKVILAYFLALIVGGVLGIICFYSDIIFQLISPIMSIVKATPVPSITMLFLFYIDSKNLPVIVAFVLVMPVIWQSVISGFKSVDKNMIEMSKVFDLSTKDRVLHVYLIKSLPYFFSAMEIGISLAFKAGISSEIVAYPINTIGRMIKDTRVYLDSPSLFAWTGVVVALSIIFERLSRLAIAVLSKKLRLQQVKNHE